MKRQPTIIDAINNPKLFGLLPRFKKLQTWTAWLVVDAMKMVGHLTESIYRRYAISDERSMRESAGKLDKFHAADQQQQNSM